MLAIQIELGFAVAAIFALVALILMGKIVGPPGPKGDRGDDGELAISPQEQPVEVSTAVTPQGPVSARRRDVEIHRDGKRIHRCQVGYRFYQEAIRLGLTLVHTDGKVGQNVSD